MNADSDARDVDPLVAELQSEACRPLLQRLLKIRGREGSLSGRIRLSGLDPSRRSAIKALTGCGGRGDSLSIDLALFDRIVRNTGRFDSLEAVVDTAGGQALVERRRKQLRRHEAWSRMWDSAEIAAAADSGVLSALDRMRRSGYLMRLSGGNVEAAKQLLDRSLELLGCLPIAPTPAAVFAAARLGDAHALDATRPLARVLIRLLAARQGIEVPVRAAPRRRLWESVGLVIDELSSTALVLNLPAVGDSLTCRTLREHAAAGMPCRISFRHLRLAPVCFAADGVQAVYVCENPSVIAAACEQLGPACPPLVCLEGNPGLACLELLDALVGGGFRIHYHGDFDWGGIRIANRIHERFGFTPWRYTAADYRPKADHGYRKLKPPRVEARWDSQLSSRLLESGVALEEESLIDDLLSDLAAR